jgi:hypothetical protein
MEGPKAFESPPLGNVSEPERNLLLRSEADDPAEAVCRKPGLGAGAVVKPGVSVTVLCLWDGSVKDSAGATVPAANRAAARCTLEGKVPALALLNPAG